SIGSSHEPERVPRTTEGNGGRPKRVPPMHLDCPRRYGVRGLWHRLQRGGAMKKRLALVGVVLAIVLATQTTFYGPPHSKPNGVAVGCVGYTWTNGIGQTGFWIGCGQ